MKELHNYLSNNGISISTKLVDALNHFKLIHLKKRESFVKEGEIGNKIAFIISGKIHPYHSIDGKDCTRWVA